VKPLDLETERVLLLTELDQASEETLLRDARRAPVARQPIWAELATAARLELARRETLS